jgi:hypothetical protein
MTMQSRSGGTGAGRRAALAGMLALAAVTALAAPVQAKTVQFTGKAVGKEADPNMRITFDLALSKGRPTAISNIRAENLDYACANGADGTDRGLTMFETGTVARSGKLSVDEPALPPGFDNYLEGRFSFPKSKGKGKKAKAKAKRAKPRVSGWITSRFGYDPESFKRFNCIAVEDFVATASK